MRIKQKFISSEDKRAMELTMFKRHVVVFLILIVDPFPCRTNEIKSVSPVWEERCSECECAEHIVDYEKAYILLPESAIVHSARQPPPLILTSSLMSSVFLSVSLFLGAQIYRMSKRPGNPTQKEQRTIYNINSQ